MCSNKAVLIFILFLSAATATAQTYPWTGILDPSRATDWTHAGVIGSPPNAPGVKGIPHRTTPCPLTASDPNYSSPSVIVNGNTIVPSGNTDMTDANNINYALQQCAALANPSSGIPNPLVLQLSAGTFYVPGAVTFGTLTNNWTAPGPFKAQANYVTLRGQGPDKTIFMVQTTGIQCGGAGNTICMSGSNEGSTSTNVPYAGGCSWTAGYAQGATILTLANCVGQSGTSAYQNGIPLQANGLPAVGYHITLDQRNDDIGLRQCSSSGTTATCIAAGPLPAAFAVGQCVGVGATGNNGAMNLAPGTIPSGWTWPASGYNTTLLSPLRYTGAGSQQCTAAITAIGTDITTGLPTFSYTLPAGGSNAAIWYCGPSPNASAVPPWGTNTLPPGVTSQVVASCFATVDPGGIYVTGISCVTAAAGNCSAANASSLGGGLSNGRVCPDPYFNGTTNRPWMPSCWQDTGHGTNEISWRSQAVVATVVACSSCASNQIAIDVPLAGANWRASQSPGVFWYHYWLHDVGVEGITFNNINDGGTTVNGIAVFQRCYNCWLRNIRSLSGSRNHFWLYDTNQHIEIRDSYLWGTKRGASQSYGVEFFYGSSDVLAENNIFEHIVSALMNGGAMGSVESYNYQVDDGLGNTVPQYNMTMQNPNHDVNGFNLFEGNSSTGSGYDNIHGTISGSVVEFRERLRAQNVPVKNNNLTSYQVWNWNRGVSILGNVLGVTAAWPPIANSASGTLYQTIYQTLYSGSGACNRAVFCSGSDSQNSNNRNDDYLATESILRWGNYDPVTAQGGDTTGIRWCGTGNEANCNIGCTAAAPPGVAPRFSASCAEIPGAFGAFLPANPVPVTHNLPASFYLPSQPAWFVTPWGTPPWPPIGPDVINGNNIFSNCVWLFCGDDNSGHSNKIPAQLAYENSPIDLTLADNRTVITSATWAISNNMGQVTMNGTFYTDLYGAFKLQGSQPSGFDGVYNIASVNGPAGGYQNVQACGSSAHPCAELPNTVNGVPFGSYIFGMTRVITATGQETIVANTTKLNTVFQSSTCTTSNPAGGGALDCTFRIPSMSASGSGSVQTDAYNVYMGVQAGNTAGSLCKQNIGPTPVPSGTAAVGSDSNPGAIAVGTIYFQTTPPILPGDSRCVPPPSQPNIPSTTITYFQAQNPCGVGVLPCNMTVFGTLTYPYIRTFNADTSYGTGQPPPATGPNGITGHGQITGQGKIT